MIELRFSPPVAARQPRTYGIAGRRLSADAPILELEGFRERTLRSRGRSTKSFARAARYGPPQLLFRAAADLGPCRRLVECRWRRGGYQLSIAELGRFIVGPGGRRITFDRAHDATSDAGLTEMALGPSLNLALALQDVWCLHASAVEIDGECVAFLGVSGAGKSTLGRALPALSGGRFRCVADDALPITLSGGDPWALPRFPQLKYRPHRQPGAAAAPSLPLAAIYLLATSPATGAGGVTVEPLTGVEAVLALVRHTHSARLFSRQLLRRHMDDLTHLANRIPLRRLIYPRELQVLPRIGAALRQGDGPPAGRTAHAPGDNSWRNSSQQGNPALAIQHANSSSWSST